MRPGCELNERGGCGQRGQLGDVSCFPVGFATFRSGRGGTLGGPQKEGAGGQDARGRGRKGRPGRQGDQTPESRLGAHAPRQAKMENHSSENP